MKSRHKARRESRFTPGKVQLQAFAELTAGALGSADGARVRLRGGEPEKEKVEELRPPLELRRVGL